MLDASHKFTFSGHVHKHYATFQQDSALMVALKIVKYCSCNGQVTYFSRKTAQIKTRFFSADVG